MLYVDSSLVVSLVAVEPSTGAAQQWLAEQSGEQLAISDWVVTEVAAALSMIQRVRGLDDVGRQRAPRNLLDLIDAAFLVLPVSRRPFRAAADMCGRADLRLRSGDALHLAVAAEVNARLITRDVAQARAAEALGLASRLVASDQDAR